jgi:hypothetical protein
MTTKLEEAWAAVHEALPAGWTVYRPVHDDGAGRWTVVARDMRPRNKRHDAIEAVRQSEAHCLRGLAELLRVWTFEHVQERST